MRRLPRLLPPLGLVALFLLTALPAGPAGAQTATLVADLQTRRNSFQEYGSLPRQLLAAGGRVFFVSTDFNSGSEIWVTDGTATGTQMPADICPGSCSSSPRLLGSSGGALFFLASSGDGLALWRSDGTRPGTFALTPPGLRAAAGSEGEPGVFLRGSLVFTACTEDGGCELWKSDGTVAGTVLVRASIRLDGLTAAGDRLFFFSRPPDSRGNALWVSDGTETGTRIVQVLDDFSPGRLTAVGSRVFFTARTDLQNALWVSDGTEAGTREVAPVSFPIRWLKAIGNRVYFVNDDVTHGLEIWRSDGTPAGTRRVTDFGFYRPVEELEPSQLAESGGRLVFVATDGIGGFHLWATSGAPESTTELCTGCNLDSARLVVAGGQVVTMAHGKPWSTDGTRAGTRALPGACASGCNSDQLVAAAGAAWFLGAEQQIWRTDGTVAGTRRFTELPDGARFPAGLLAFATVGPRVYFPAAAGGFGDELWGSDGRSGGTRLVADLVQEDTSSNPDHLVDLDGQLLFAACVDSSRDLWQSTGSAASPPASLRPFPRAVRRATARRGSPGRAASSSSGRAPAVTTGSSGAATAPRAAPGDSLISPRASPRLCSSMPSGNSSSTS